MTDGPRRLQSQYTIIRILQEEVHKNARDTRSLFYLARAQEIVSNFSAAHQAYTQLASVSGWDEEVWEARFASALLLERLDRRKESAS